MKTGNPVRKNIVSLQLSREDAKRRLGFNPNRPLVVVVGGSLGARTINDAMKKAVEPLLEKGASILWQTGRLYATNAAPPRPTSPTRTSRLCPSWPTWIWPTAPPT